LAGLAVAFGTDLYILEKNGFKLYFEVIKIVTNVIKLNQTISNKERVGDIYSEFGLYTNYNTIIQ